jgi:hypothetical protein
MGTENQSPGATPGAVGRGPGGAKDKAATEARNFLIVLLMPLVFTLLLIFGIGAALGGCALYEYFAQNALKNENEDAAKALAAGIVRCAASTGRLPNTTSPVPALFEQVHKERYTPSSSDYAAPTWQCAGFAPTDQQFQIQWIREGPNQGSAVALTKQVDKLLFWSHRVDQRASVSVQCSEGKCTASEYASLQYGAGPGLETPSP